ncbi:cob(I)yrinic acid a,c-diamide adenosyltransferase [Chloroflexota bacterium]
MRKTSSITGSSSSRSLSKGLIQIFTGDGKGKTSAAVGTVVRALGQGLKVCVVIFMKGNHPSGEWTFLSKIPDVKIARFGLGILTDPSGIKPKEKEQAREALDFASQAVLSGDYDLVVMDEVNVALGWKIIEVDEVVRLIRDKPPEVELILTGRWADAKLIQLADLVTECTKIKHPYDKGIKARRGIEF